MKKAAIKLWQHTIKHLMPPCCVACGQTTNETFICQHCLAKIESPPIACQQCGLALYEEAERCGQCLKSPPAFDRLYCLGDFKAPLSTIIQQFKFQENLACGQALSQALIQKLKIKYANEQWPEQLVAVPLHYKRLRQRGFNQSVELAKPLARSFNLKLVTKHCKRIKATTRQSELDSKARQLNLQRAFCLQQKIIANHIAIVDDVVTTTATVNSLALCLRQSGIKRIDIWCCARTQHH